jgi:transposase-like protein
MFSGRRTNIKNKLAMHRIVFAFLTLEQHLRAVVTTPQSYRPDHCPHCGFGCLWGHGCYERKADRSADGDLNPVAVPRFQCPSCRRTCSRLPLCICPRRWYAWALQQQVLQLLIAGASLRRTAAIFALGYHTVRRWWRWLSTVHEDFSFHLRSRFASLGRSVGFATFWLACLQLMPLCEAMAWLDHDSVAVP